MGALKLWKAAILLALLSAVAVAFVLGRSKRRELALALGSSIFALLAGEVVLRIFFPQLSEHNQLFRYDPEMGWGFVPGRRARIVCPGEVDHQVTINALGFRDVERDLARKDKKRVLVLGDSFVSNVDVEAEEVFTRVMERQLEDTEVLNFGVNGFGQVQEYRLLEAWCDRVKPDVVMVVIYLRNDFLDNVEPRWTYGRPFVSLEGPGSTLVFHPIAAGSASGRRDPAWKIYQRSHVWTLIDRSLESLLRGAAPGDSEESQASAYTRQELALYDRTPAPSTARMFAAMTRLIARFEAFSSARGVPMVFVLAPSPVQIYDDLWLEATGDAPEARYGRALPNERLRQFAEDNGVRMVDLLPAFSPAGKKNDRSLYFRYEQHWTREGNRLAAQVLLEYLTGATIIPGGFRRARR